MPSAPPLVVAASTVIRDGMGRILLVRRGHEPNKGRWSLPGGKALPGEDPRATACRETREETGLDIDVRRELWTIRVPDGDRRIFEIHTFLARNMVGEPRAADDAAELLWAGAREFATLPLTANLRELLDAVGLRAV
ncbi:MAG TPA: NUDIX domain-containing protein [Microbacteriaceae bacterium]|nr:NUDIX domain-containing protein [Microbacteriaceae bacterium]